LSQNLDGGPEVADNSRDQFRHGGVDRHRPLQDRIGRSRIHHIQDAVDRLVPAYPQDGGSKVNITDVDPVERPEEVYWVDPIHKRPD
jgi:hypothetical protein